VVVVEVLELLLVQSGPSQTNASSPPHPDTAVSNAMSNPAPSSLVTKPPVNLLKVLRDTTSIPFMITYLWVNSMFI
jgi:hypothetical protein